MAEAIFNALISDADIPYEVQSAGVAALVDEPMILDVAAVLEVGVYARGYRARQVNGIMLEETDLVLAMASQYAGAAQRLFAISSEKIYPLLGYAKRVERFEGTLARP